MKPVPTGFGALRSLESILALIIAALFLTSFFFPSILSENAIWLLALILFSAYAILRIVTGSGRTEKYFLILFPVMAGSIWQFGIQFYLDLTPVLIITVGVLYFCFPFVDATKGVVFLMIIAIIPPITGRGDLLNLLWLPMSGGIWGLMFWLLRREREIARTRYDSIESRARELMSVSRLEPDDESVPDLATETQIADAAATAFQIESMVGWILQMISDVLYSHSAFFFFLDQETNLLKVLTYSSKSKFFNSAATIHVESGGFLAWVVQHQRPLRYERLPKESQFPGYYSARERILSCMIHPVIKSDVVQGVLGVDSRRSHSFGGDSESLLKSCANLIGEVVEAFRNYEQQKFNAKYMQTFYKSIKRILESRLDLDRRVELLLEITEKIKKSEDIAIAIQDDSGVLTVRNAKGIYFKKVEGMAISENSLLASVIQQGMDPVLFDEFQLEELPAGLFFAEEPTLRYNSVMVVPLPMENEVIGLLILASMRREYFTESDISIFGSLAVQFGFALENAINVERIEHLAIRDGLTGVYNHRYFQDSLQKEIQRAERQPSVFSLLMIDIDYFKKFNDTYGHQAGDEVLKGIATLLEQQARAGDIVARYGGEEFVLILVNCDLKMAFKTADRIRKTCDKRTFDIGNQTVNVTMSIGIGNFPEHTDQGTHLIACADKALYKAKSSGRNRVEVYDPSMDH